MDLKDITDLSVGGVNSVLDRMALQRAKAIHKQAAKGLVKRAVKKGVTVVCVLAAYEGLRFVVKEYLTYKQDIAMPPYIPPAGDYGYNSPPSSPPVREDVVDDEPPLEPPKAKSKPKKKA